MGKDWKAITLDHAALSSFDDLVPITVCLTQRQVAILKALMITAYWTTRWTNLVITPGELEQSMALIDYKLDGNDCSGGGGDMTDFRDDPNNPCSVQYSTDGGLTWLHMFDKSTCNQYAPVPMTVNIAQESVVVINDNDTIYNGNIINIAPTFTWSPEIPGDGTLTNRLICFTVRQWVKVVCDTLALEIDAGGNILEDIARFAGDLVLSLTNTALYILTETIGPPNEFVSATAWASAVFWLGVLQWALTYESADFRDVSAREAIACHMYHQLKNATPQFAAWRDALVGFVPTNVSETAISGAVGLTLQEEDAYVNYLNMVQNVKDFADQLPQCPCPEPFVIDQLRGDVAEIYETAFTTPMTEPIGGVTAPGIYFAPLDVYSHVTASTGNIACCVRTELPAGVLVTKVRTKIIATRPNQTTVGSRIAHVYLGDPNAGGLHIGQYSWGGGSYTTARTIILTMTDGIDFVTQPADAVYIINQMDKTSGDADIHWIHIEGVVAP